MSSQSQIKHEASDGEWHDGPKKDCKQCAPKTVKGMVPLSRDDFEVLPGMRSLEDS